MESGGVITAMSNVKQYTDILRKLNFQNMYEGDFFLTWEKTRDELDAVFTVADALRHLRENNISTKGPASPLHQPAICLGWKSRIWMKGKARSHMVRQSGKPRTW